MCIFYSGLPRNDCVEDLKKAEELAPLATDRKNFGYQKEMLFGENVAIILHHGPAHMLKNSEDFKS